MSGIFICYRRDDTAPYARLLRESLAARFGRDEIYRDLDSMGPGVDFPEAVAEALSTCDALLALIGPGWLATRPDGSRRIDDPADYVRGEVAAALQRDDILVVPVLIGGTPMPSRAELPEALAELADRNAHRLADEGWDDSVERLISALATVVRTTGRSRQRRWPWPWPSPSPSPSPSRRLRKPAVAVAALALAVGGGLVVRGWLDDEPDRDNKIVRNIVRPIMCAFGEVTIAAQPGERLGLITTFSITISTAVAGVGVPGLDYVGVVLPEDRSDIALTSEYSTWPSSPTDLVPRTSFERTIALKGAVTGTLLRIRVDRVTGPGPECSLVSYEVRVP